MASKIKSQYKTQVFLLICGIFLLMILSADSPLDLGEDLASLINYQSGNFFGLFKAVYYIPNMIIPIISGFIIDYIGLIYVLLSISCFGIVGQLYMFLYIYNECECMSFEYLFVGRVLYCISCETICVSVFSYLSMWFQGLKIGEYVGLLVGLNGVESLIFTALSAHLFRHSPGDLQDREDIRSKYKWLFGFNLIMTIGIMLLSIYLFKIDRNVERQENKVPVLKQHPDKMLGFWKSLKKSLRQNFILICLAFSFMYCSFQSLRGNVHDVLTLIIWGSQPYCNAKNTVSLNVLHETLYIFSVILTIISDVVIMLVPFFVGKYLIQKKKRYLTTLFGSFLMLFSIGMVMAILRNKCADSSIKIGLFIVSILLCDLGYACQYGLLYASVALMTKQNLIGTRFGILHAMKNFVFFFFTDFQTNLEISSTMDNQDLNRSIDAYKTMFLRTFGLLVIQILIYALIVNRMDEKGKGKDDGMSSTNLDELSTFIKK